MINELKKMLMNKFCKEQNVEPEIVINGNDEDYRNIVELNHILKEENIKLQKLLDVALDEIVQNQERVKSLLNQLKDKNGGK